MEDEDCFLSSWKTNKALCSLGQSSSKKGRMVQYVRKCLRKRYNESWPSADSEPGPGVVLPLIMLTNVQLKKKKINLVS